MLRFIRCFVWVLGTAVMVPATCPAVDNCWTAFPLPSALKVGQRWTYLTIGEQLDLNSGAILSSRTDTLTISVVSHRQIEDRTYFVLRYNDFQGLYQVDDCRRTWWYNADNGTEVLCWDIWGLLPESEEMVFHGEPRPYYDQLERLGPLELYDSPSLDHPFFGLYPDSTYGIPELGGWLENLLAWEAISLYKFLTRVFEEDYSILIAPNVGVLLYYFVGSGETAWTSILLSYEPGDSEQISTSIEDASFGEIKEWRRKGAQGP